MAVGEAHNILVIGTSPGVDTLCIIANGHDLMMQGQGINYIRLKPVGILEFIDQDVPEAVLVKCGYIGVFSKKL